MHHCGGTGQTGYLVKGSDHLIKNSQAVKNRVRPPKKARMKKDVKSKVAAKKWL